MMRTIDDFLREHGEEFGGEKSEKRQADGNICPVILDPKTPLKSAMKFIAGCYIQSGVVTLRHQNDAFYAWNGSCYAEIGAGDIRARLYKFLGKSVVKTDGGGTAPFHPNRHRVSDVLDALKAVTNLPSTTQAPAWLIDKPDVPAHAIIACSNGLLHIGTRELMPSTPAFYTHNALDFGYDPDAGEPTEFLTFLHSLWPEDPEAIATLQEIFGYMLTADTRQQKAFLIVGPIRSGKGTIARILTRLMGRENTTSPTTKGLTTNFGMQPLIGKRLAIISDARLKGSDKQIFAERLLSITGEDSITIDRKYQSAWTGRLQTRFLLLSNKLLRFSDASGAVVSRFIVLTLITSFFGREDLGLESRLVAELPRILNWALQGWERLSKRGYFCQPASSTEAIRQMEDLSSPVGAFLRDCCIVGPGRTVGVDTLFDEWKRWCQRQGRDHPGNSQTLGRDLRTVLPTLKVTQPWDGDHRVRLYDGLSLQIE